MSLAEIFINKKKKEIILYKQKLEYLKANCSPYDQCPYYEGSTVKKSRALIKERIEKLTEQIKNASSHG